MTPITLTAAQTKALNDISNNRVHSSSLRIEGIGEGFIRVNQWDTYYRNYKCLCVLNRKGERLDK